VPPADWDPQHVVDAAAAAELLAEQFPDLAGLPVVPLAVGWDNTVHLVGGEWVFRFPRREIAVDGVRRELAVLPWLAPRLPLPIPDPAYVGEANGWPFWGARVVPGEELVSLAERMRTRAGAAAGRFLSGLHSTEVRSDLAARLPHDPMRRATPSARIPIARKWLAALDPATVPDLEPLFAAAEQLPPPTGREVLSHGDLHPRHLLVDDAGDASGVIDWGDLCVADPAVDLSLGYSGFVGSSRTAFFSAYGDVDEETALRARALATSLCAALAAYAKAEGDHVLLADSLRGLHRCADSALA
jgi:aminoglycoside phosphotransferase (APT) family kinase protein